MAIKYIISQGAAAQVGWAAVSLGVWGQSGELGHAPESPHSCLLLVSPADQALITKY